MACECRRYQAQGWCDHENPKGERTFWYREGHHQPVAQRNRDYEQEFLTYVEQLAEHLGAPPDNAFTKLVNHRANSTGADSYGDASFLTDGRDLPLEAAEEAGDLGVYAVFDIEKHGDKPGDEAYHYAAQAAAHAAVALYHLRHLQRLRRG